MKLIKVRCKKDAMEFGKKLKVDAETSLFNSKEWMDFEDKVSKAKKTFGRDKEFNVDFSLQRGGKISGAVSGPSGTAMYFQTSVFTKNLTENQKEAKSFLKVLIDYADSLKSAIDYVDKTAKDLQKMVDNFSEELKNVLHI